MAESYTKPLLEEVRLLAQLLHRRSEFEDSGLSSSGANVLETLRDIGLSTVPELARAKNSSRQNIQLIMNRLAREGWLQWKNNPAHKRSDLAQLTEAGKDALLRWIEHQRGSLEKLAANISEDELGTAATVLRRIREQASGVRDSTASEGNTLKVAQLSQPDLEKEELPVNLL